MISLLTVATLIMFVGAGLLISAGLGWVAAAVTKNKGGKAVAFILSAMFGGFVIGGFAGVFNYTRIKAGEATVRKGWNLKPVVVAAVDIQAGEAITFDQISQRSLPEQFVTDAMVIPERAAEVVSQRARYAVQAGDVLLWGFTCPSGR
jgi:Flp pilus assembly protein CpaB